VPGTLVHSLVLAIALAAATGDADPHVAALRERLGPGAWTIVVEPPFVVAGDEDAATVKRRAEKSIRWAAEKLKQEFFAKDPDGYLDVYLFKDEKSYESNAIRLFGEKPTTPYGYYSSRHRALVMNIATGGGTLVHEIVHPYVEANFPGCPAWFNEGLGSLYERCTERDGRIVGLTNWRLEKLKEAIEKKETVPFEKLLGTSAAEFYGGDERGVHYAQARYLCYYLQEKGLLARYYREFHAARESDPGGVATLKRILGAPDLEEFRKEWERFVRALTYP